MEKGPVTDGYMINGVGFDRPVEQEVPQAERLLKEFESHDGKEGKVIQSYKEIATKSKDPLIKFLLQMIIFDEERHHAVMHAMASSLWGSFNWTKPQDAIPSLSELVEEQEELMKLTGDFIKLEKDGIKESKKLLKSTKGYYQGLFTLLITTMIHDSEKHVEILDFLRKRLKIA